MNTLLEVRSGPSYYACIANVLDSVETKLSNANIRKVLVIHGDKSWKVAEPFFPSFEHVETSFFKYNGECSDVEIERVRKFAQEQGVDALIGVGGGKLLDLAKSAGNFIGKEIILIPTLASTCAAWTPLSVIYDSNGSYVRFDIHEKSAWMLLIEPGILLDSPISYLRAGIGDTLAKWYEGNALVEKIATKSACIELAHIAARQCQEVLLTHGEDALADLEKGKWTDALQRVIETNIVTSGLVGGFGDQFLRIAGAHSIHNGMTSVTQTHHLLHGEKVAFGILVQLLLEGKFWDIKQLLPIYEALKLPRTLSDIGLTVGNGAEIQKMAALSVMEGEAIHLLFPGIGPENVTAAIENLDIIATH
ncbi:iron-containing alcohol dehydrogenase family protein [Peribacillus muralis]|uniref:iron-containing alcohol dehydrogenase family protein n=1 Tax=Peribacillus muralis TaxID=264697 RepID=UPI001F4EA75E|nr:iron-containing alcohol dehydrogenase family protein [Peribacillus muralis]MCK1992992.1 iron-containing alcohol dehydrogenase family protein [Peribacillus muralis]MCK2013547.1 iron-containing alcohol dehydrogenase family protein [Peribacillus muralis]